MTDRAWADAQILIVDDEPANVRLLERILHREGYTRLHTTTDSRQVPSLVTSVGPDLLLLDLQMPHHDGFDVLEMLARSLPDGEFLPILVLTADSTAEVRDRALRLGAKDFLTKPFDRAEAVLRIANLLETRRLHLRLREHNRALQAELDRQAEAERRSAAERSERLQRIELVLVTSAFTMLFQPIVDLQTGAVVGVESLARFAGQPQRTPDVWFAEAAAVDLGVDLELAAIDAACAQLDRLPRGGYLSVNASPQTLLSGSLAARFAGLAGERIVVELTEHAPVGDYPAVTEAMSVLRDMGVRLAIDDTGSGFASLEHVLRLNPDIVKLDIALTRGIDADPVRRALASALLTFTGEINATIIAEGVETEAELQTLRALDVRYGQGYHLSRPGALPLPHDRLDHVSIFPRTR
ncbi:MAG: EAL domain-containing protein [Mycobacteriales bacterium]